MAMASFLTGASKKAEMARQIEEQQAQIEMYAKKLKDVIRAYKGLTAEKRALEASLQALSEQRAMSATDGDEPRASSTEAQSDAESTDLSIDQGDISTGRALRTLQKSLATITLEKSRLESAFTQDRKAFKTRLGEQQRELDAALQQSAALAAAAREAQSERDAALGDHGAVLRQVQQQLAEERRAAAGDADELRAELADCRRSLESNDVGRMQREVAEMTAQHARALERETKRAQEAQTALAQLADQSEKRVSGLEQRIAEMCETVVRCQHQQEEDRGSIDKLKAKIARLDEENFALAQTTKLARPQDQKEIVAQLKQLCSRLRSEHSVVSAEFYEILGLESPLDEDVHAACQEKLNSLRDDFEKYKLRAQTVLKSKQKDSAADGDNDAKTAHLKEVITSLHNKQQDTEERLSASETKHEAAMASMRQNLADQRESHRRQLAETEERCAARAADCDAEMQKQRERTLDALADKQRELDTTRTILATVRQSAGGVPADPVVGKPPTPASPTLSGGGRHSSVDWADQSAAGDNYFSSCETTRREQIVGRLRRENAELQATLRQLEQASVAKGLRSLETIEALKDELRALEGKLRLYREDANLEYLRNVLVQYVLCDNLQEKQHMLKAISQVLKLSSKEYDAIRRHNDVRFRFWTNASK